MRELDGKPRASWVDFGVILCIVLVVQPFERKRTSFVITQCSTAMHTQHDRTPSFSGRAHSHTTSKLQTNDIAYRQPTASILSDRLMLRLYIFCILFVSASRSQQMYVYSDYWFVLFARYSEVCQIGCTLFHCIYWGKRHRIMHIWALLYCVTFSPPTEYFFSQLVGGPPKQDGSLVVWDMYWHVLKMAYVIS